jgi:hypothetical protein
LEKQKKFTIFDSDEIVGGRRLPEQCENDSKYSIIMNARKNIKFLTGETSDCVLNFVKRSGASHPTFHHQNKIYVNTGQPPRLPLNIEKEEL